MCDNLHGACLGADDDKGATSRGGKPRKLLGKNSKRQETTGVLGWAYKKYRTVRHAAHGTFNRVAKVGNSASTSMLVCNNTPMTCLGALIFIKKSVWEEIYSFSLWAPSGVLWNADK